MSVLPTSLGCLADYALLPSGRRGVGAPAPFGKPVELRIRTRGSESPIRSMNSSVGSSCSRQLA